MAINTNTVQLVLSVKDDGSIVVEKFEGKVGDLEKAVDKSAKGPMKSFQEGWVGITAKIAIATGVIYGAARAISGFVDEAAEAEEIENRLRFSTETLGYSWQYAKTAVDAFANSVQESTRFSDEQARQALIDMLMYTRDFGKAQEGARLAMDMSVRTGQDLTSASRLIGMAMSGNVEMLGRYIPELRNLDNTLGSNASNAQKAEYAMRILHEKFGGTAQADIDSYAGKLAQFKNSWSDVREELGRKVLPVLKDVLDYVTKISRELTKEAPYKETPLFKFLGIEVTRRVELKGEELEEVLRQRQRIAQFQAQGLAGETKPDILPDLKKEVDIVKEVMAAYEAVIQRENELGEIAMARQELSELGWIKEKDIVSQVTEELIRLERETNEWGEITVGKQDLIESNWKKIKDRETETNRILLEAARLTGDTNLEREIQLKLLEEEIKQLVKMGVSEDAIKKYADAVKFSLSDVGQMWKTFNQTMSSAMAQNLTQMIKGAESWREAMMNIIGSVADAMLSTMLQMGIKAGMGAIGFSVLAMREGGIVRGEPVPVYGFQHGGVIKTNRPTLFMTSETGEEEYIIPKSKMGQGRESQTVIYNLITAVDAKSFDDMMKRNAASVMSISSRDAKGAGIMRNIMKGIR